MKHLSGEEIALRDMARHGLGNGCADLFIPELDQYVVMFPDKTGAYIISKNIGYTHIDKHMGFYKSLCDSKPIGGFLSEGKMYSQTANKYYQIALLKRENGRCYGIQKKHLKYRKSQEYQAIYYDPGRRWFWFMDLDTFTPYMVVCACQCKEEFYFD